MKKLKIWNGGDWDHRGGHVFVCAHSVKDAAELICEAYKKIKGYVDRPDIKIVSEGEIRTYYSAGCWGNSMEGVVPERGVWWIKSNGYGRPVDGKPERVL